MSDVAISAILSILVGILKWYGASEATIQAYMTLVESTKNDGLISVATKDKFVDQKQAILDRLKAKQGKTNVPS